MEADEQRHGLVARRQIDERLLLRTVGRGLERRSLDLRRPRSDGTINADDHRDDRQDQKAESRRSQGSLLHGSYLEPSGE
jgi:hypothetical protein